MTQWRCTRCEGWFESDESHDIQHLEERKVEAMERIAAALGNGTGMCPFCGNTVDVVEVVAK